MFFARTARLQIRAVDTSDGPAWLRIRSEYAVLSSSTFGYVVPPGPSTWEHNKKWLEDALFAGFVEVKEEFAHLRRVLPDEEGNDPEPPKEESEKHIQWERRQRAVGFVLLTVPPKNRDAQLGLLFSTSWHNLGLGTELMRWLVPYAFEQLGMHRLSLEVVESNVAARRVYQKVGFAEEGRKKGAVWQDGGWKDIVLMAILEEEYWAGRNRHTVNATSTI
ncbi:acyl-CoA N-acyltransferase [Calocera cornea HHB12733]|uniref:Acyl-CoA N-acyltransferase n=1 Tax=Calocera cornea HHB12733 TaxID=1353952 RepID=A0A165I2D3_9BASI|nr:acyl-CoA N-acyltransferase [Calocera cornea HHB12733]